MVRGVSHGTDAKAAQTEVPGALDGTGKFALLLGAHT